MLKLLFKWQIATPIKTALRWVRSIPDRSGDSISEILSGREYRPNIWLKHLSQWRIRNPETKTIRITDLLKKGCFTTTVKAARGGCEGCSASCRL